MLKATEDQVFFGGSKGGGKTDALLMDGYYTCQQPGARVLLLRRTFADLSLPGAAIDRSHELFTGLAKWNGAKYRWTFPNGARLQFGHLQHEHSKFKYQGAQVDKVLWDELTQFLEEQFDYVWMSVRSPRGYRVQFGATGNPGGIGHGWVRRRYIEPAQAAGGGAFIVKNSDGETWGTARFIPARLDDNRALLRADPDYARRLKSLPEALRKAYLEGDWDVFEGQVFAVWRDARHVVKPFAIDWARSDCVAGLDWGVARPFVCLWGVYGARLVDDPPRATDPDTGKPHPCDRRHLYIHREIAERGLLDEEMARRCAGALARDADGKVIERVSAWWADPASFFAAHDRTGTIPADVFRLEAGIDLWPSNNERLFGKRAVESWLADCACGVPRMRVFSTCHELIRTLPSLPYSKTNVEDVDTDADDDAYDSLRYLIQGGTPRGRDPHAERSRVAVGGLHA